MTGEDGDHRESPVASRCSMPPPGPLNGRLAPASLFPAGDPGLTSRFVRLRGGICVRLDEAGPSNGSPVVMLHGWGGSAYTFHRTLPALAERGFLAIAVDLKGHGLTDKPLAPAAYTLDAMVRHFADVLDARGIRRAALVGHSLGGAVALAFAGRHPERVSHLALLGAARLGPIGFAPLIRLLARQGIERLVPHFCTRANVALTLWFAHGTRSRFTDRDVDEYWGPTQYPEMLRAAAALIREFTWTPPSADELRAVESPTLVLVGERDRVITSHAAADYAALIARGRFRSLPGEGHLFVESSPEITNAELLRLLTVGESP